MINTSQHFIDLHNVASLVLLTWPAVRSLAPSDEHAEILDQNVARRHQQRAALAERHKHFYHLHTLTSPAANSAAYAAVTAIAHRILKSTDQQALELVAPIQPRLQVIQGPEQDVGDTLRNSHRSSPPLRIILARHQRPTPGAMNSYRQQPHEWRPASKDPS
ncbi:hypothetical protein [Streptomyces orinoci]|uniref:Uncharacterized protein n=1 Tax=Streptomyces orinoci TaxID=67339 RepID=A0ABV3JTK9_STRON|nr:hypothetical protein [Streptomyces orinoci]